MDNLGAAFQRQLPSSAFRHGVEQESYMQQQQTKLTKMSCPACGFQVFNRRYLKCERCNSDLPASLVYSDKERRALLEKEEARLSQELKRRELHRSLKASRRQRTSSAPGIAVLEPTVTNDGGTGATVSISDGFVSGGGGVFDGGGASGSFGGDSGSSSSSD
jgi:hypothetical protein